MLDTLITTWGELSFGERFHLLLGLLWVAMIPPTIFLWKDSVPYLVFISVYAVIVGHISAYQAAKAERNSPDA
jgi:hypothetical protein